MHSFSVAAAWLACWGGAVTAFADPNAVNDPADVTAEDLMGIVDLGVTGSWPSGGVAISPQRRSVAIEARTADWRTNRVRIRWLIVPLDPSRPIVEAGDGGQPIPTMFDDVSTGYSAPQLPLWSADSEWIVYRALVDGEVQLWRSRADGSVQQRLTNNEADVEEFRWCEHGNRLLFSVGQPRRRIQQTLRNEASRGYLYDQRFDLLKMGRPVPASPNWDAGKSTLWTYDLNSGDEAPATQERHCEGEDQVASSPLALPRVRFPSSMLLIAEGERGVGLEPMHTLAFAKSKNRVIACTSPLCTGRFRGSWLSKDAKTAYGLRWSGAYNYGPMTLIGWRPGSGRVWRILDTDDLLEGCSQAGEVLICRQSSTTHPGILTAVSLMDGKRQTLYDPNPGFRRKRFGEVTQLHWVDEEGTEGYGHVVKPPRYVQGTRYPLVVVQYRSAGFLRGGVGDEYPIHVLAAQGFVVLSFSRPDEWPLLAMSKSYDEVKQRGWDGFYDRRRVLSVLEAGIDQLVQQGLVDSQRMGITGLSDGAETLAFALIHSPNLFAAAAVSGTFWNPISYYVAGPRGQPVLERWGFKEPMRGSESQWQGISLALNAARVETPLLIHVADAEMLTDTQTVASLGAAGKAVEMYVFPEEFHIKSQPAHRYAIYVRNVQWFKFWLQGIEDEHALDARQYDRWRTMRAKQRDAAVSRR
jgi:dienelactone hydrolase